MPDKLDNLYDDLSGRLPNKQDKDLLKTLLSAMREGGKDTVVEKIEEILEDLVEEDR